MHVGGKEPIWYSRNSLLITSVFSILCFFPMGIIALYYGIKVSMIGPVDRIHSSIMYATLLYHNVIAII